MLQLLLLAVFLQLPLGPRDGADLPPTDLNRVKVGQIAPDFTLQDENGNPATLSSFRNKNNVVLVFYRGHWCPHPTTLIIDS